MAYPNLSVANTNADATGTVMQLWSSILQMKSMPDDIFFSISGNYNQNTKSIPNSVYIQFPSDVTQDMGAYSCTFPLLMPLSSDPNYGTGTDPISTAEQQSLRQFIAYFNDYEKSVKGFSSGIQYLLGKPYQLLPKITPQIAQFLKEMFGYWVRYAMLNGISPNLAYAPTSLSIKPHPNTLIRGTTLAQQPAERYQTNAALQASIIAAEMNNIPATTGGALNVKAIMAVQDYFFYRKPIAPLSIGGEDVLIMTVPSSQKSYLLNPANTDGTGAVWQATQARKDSSVQDLPLYLGQVGRMVLVEDPRAPIACAFGTGSGSATASATNAIYVDKYHKPGRDERPDFAAQANIFEACFILGKGSFADMEPEPAHYEQEKQYLSKLIVRGALGSRGYTRVEFDKSTPTSTTLVNQGSGVLWCRQQSTSF